MCPPEREPATARSGTRRVRRLTFDRGETDSRELYDERADGLESFSQFASERPLSARSALPEVRPPWRGVRGFQGSRRSRKQPRRQELTAPWTKKFQR
jgi:hypothetical protein